MLNSAAFTQIAQVYNKLINFESQGYSNYDEHMDMLSHLDDEQLYKEAYILLQDHKSKSTRPDLDVPNPDLFVPALIGAVASLITSYEQIGAMDEGERYILQSYLALHHAKKLKFVARSNY